MKYSARELWPVRVCAALAVLILLILPAPASSEQSEEERNFLLTYFTEDELQVVSSTRSIKSISRVAENMTVVTAKDIERMNAHTLAEVLNTVNGVHVWLQGSAPGNFAFADIQGADQTRVTVFIDGVIQNNLSNFADVGMIPVQNIEKIEIIKGPASAAWGTALGGLINVITKEPTRAGIHAVASVSYGSNNTEDVRAELSGRSGNMGIYLNAGKLHSNGFIPGTDVINNNFYTKAVYSPSPDTDIKFTASYIGAKRGDGDYAEAYGVKDKDRDELFFGTLSMNSRLSSDLSLNVQGDAQRNRKARGETDLTTFTVTNWVWDDRRYGGSARLVWTPQNQTVVLGAEYNSGTEKSEVLMDGKQTLRRWAIFTNDTIVIDKFAVTPGVRYENTSTNGDFVSPSIGATYQLTGKTILRATVARGFYIPTLNDTFGTSGGLLPNPNLQVEKVWSYQVGAETGELKYLWLKVSAFRHDVSDVINEAANPTINGGRQRRQGIETEMRTVPVYNITLSAGTTYIFAKDLETNQVIFRVPKYTYDVAVAYDDMKSLKAVLRGHYIWWNSDPDLNSKYSDFIFDLSLTKTLFKKKDHSMDLFVTVHNLFDGSQYMGSFYRNAARWAEIGLRYKF